MKLSIMTTEKFSYLSFLISNIFLFLKNSSIGLKNYFRSCLKKNRIDVFCARWG